MNLEKAYDRVNRETLFQVLRMYDVGGSKLFNGIRVFVNILTFLRIKKGEREIVSGFILA